MAAWQRFGVGLFSTVALALLGLIYTRVFSDALMPLIDPDGQFSTPIVWLDQLVPVIVVGLLLFVWVWVIAGAVQDERTVNRRRVR